MFGSYFYFQWQDEVIKPSTYVDYIEEYMAVPTKTSEQTLRDVAYTIEVSDADLVNIKTTFLNAQENWYSSYENVRLTHYYGTILNRYEPELNYQRAVTLAEYIFDGVITREQAVDGYHPHIYTVILQNLVGQSNSEETIKRVAIDFHLFASEDTKHTVYTLAEQSLNKTPQTEFAKVQQRFFTYLLASK